MNDQHLTPIRTALISVSDKTGIVALAQKLSDLKIHLISTGGTARLLKEAGLTITEVAEYTNFPEIMDGRVKTLHPKIYGGILGRRQIDDAVMTEHGMKPIDLVIVNLYPFEKVINDPLCSDSKAIENIDIGGPCMVRAAAKNHRHVTVVVDPNDYDNLLIQLHEQQGQMTFVQRRQFAQKAFQHTAHYDQKIYQYLAADEASFPASLTLNLTKKLDLRYGENPHQQAAFYTDEQVNKANIASARVLQGKSLSYNNIADGDAALECVKQFTQPACVIVKHANPCGVACAKDQLTAYERAYATDPTSAFGGIIAFNEPLTEETAHRILANQFVEVIIAPGITDAAQTHLRTKPNLRVLVCQPWDNQPTPYLDYKRVNGGLLVQTIDHHQLTNEQLSCVSKCQPNSEQLANALFAWQVVQYIKSNGIVYVNHYTTLGIGAGQMSRIDSATIGALKAQQANLSLKGAVLASDAFFPFRDVVDYAHTLGIQTIIQPGGSIRDEEVIAAANEYKIGMIFTGVRHFRH